MTANQKTALFIGQTYIDVTFLTDHVPTGDEKYVASEYAVSFGGNAVTAAFCCAKLSAQVVLIASLADDWLGHMFKEMAEKYDVALRGRKVEKSSLSFIMPNNGKRAIVRCRDDRYLEAFQEVDVTAFGALHVDGHQHDAALAYAQKCRAAGILTSLDGGAVRSNTDELLRFIDVAVVSERFCDQMNKSPDEMLDYLKTCGCRIGGITRSERGLIWYDEDGAVQTTPSLPVPANQVIDTSGAGDVFHGAYIYSYLANPHKRWREHFQFASAASAFKVQRLGNEAGLPSLADIANVQQALGLQADGTARPA